MTAPHNVEQPLRPTYDEMRAQFKSDRYTGYTIVHWAEGEETLVDVPQDFLRIRLDKRRKLKQD